MSPATSSLNTGTATATGFRTLIHSLTRTVALALMLILVLASLPVRALDLGGSSLFETSNQDFLPVDQALPFGFSSERGAVILQWDIAPKHYLYKDRISIQAVEDGVILGEPSYSLPGTATEDEYFGEVTVFYQPITVTVPVTLPAGQQEANLKVSYQGCAEAGLCYPPQTQDVLYYPGGAGSTATSTPAPATTNQASVTDTESAAGLASVLANQPLWVIAGLFLLLGLGLTFTPCVLPMVPIISSLVSSQNTQTTLHALLLSLSYVLGMALTYAAAGVVTGLLGASFNLQAQLQSPWVLGVFATLFVLFALSMFNLYDLQLPAVIRDRLNQASHRLTGSRVASIFGIGALSALVVSPCVSAPLAGSLLYISTTQDAVVGGLALFALGLGMGVPLILVAVGGRRLLPGTGPWMNVVKSFYGIMLLAVAIWLVERLVPAWLTLTLWGALAAVTGVQLGAFDGAKAGWQRTWKGCGLILFSYGIALLAGALAGAHDPLKPLSPFTASAATTTIEDPTDAGFQRMEDPDAIRQALASASASARPVILDFYADWCISCKVMERDVFSDPAVHRAMADYTLLQIDLTDNTPSQQALLNELGLFGPPAILFYEASGEESQSLRVLGEMDRDQFLAHLQKVRLARQG